MGYTQPSKACSRATTPMRGYATVERYFPGCEFGALEAQVGFWTASLKSVIPGHGMSIASPRAVPK